MRAKHSTRGGERVRENNEPVGGKNSGSGGVSEWAEPQKDNLAPLWSGPHPMVKRAMK